MRASFDREGGVYMGGEVGSRFGCCVCVSLLCVRFDSEFLSRVAWYFDKDHLASPVVQVGP